MAIKSLDTKIARILADPNCDEFILTDSKDADMAGGMASPGLRFGHTEDDEEYRTMKDYYQSIRENVELGLIDLIIMSSSTSHRLTHIEKIFENSLVTPAVRLNDPSDIWMAKGSLYSDGPSRPFRSTTIEHAMYGKLSPKEEEKETAVDLGLYSITFNNSTNYDWETLKAYKEFRVEAEQKGMKHILEVFNPNAAQAPIEDLGRFLSDNVSRALAGVCGEGRPILLKVPYHGPNNMEQLCSYDPNMIVGILGGSSGTTLDAFHQMWEAKKYGARVAMYGRLINNSEHQPTFIRHLRQLADDGFTDPAEAVVSYHSSLKMQQLVPFRKLEDDLILTQTDPNTAYKAQTVSSSSSGVFRMNG